VKRYVATIYRRKWFYLSVIVLLLGAAVAGSAVLSNPYQTTARIWVDRPTVSSVVDQQQTFVTQTPAQQQGDMLYQLIQTDSFMIAILKDTSGAGQLNGDLQHDGRVVATIRSGLAYSVLGPNTLMISLKGGQPQLSQEIVQGTIDEFRKWLLQSQSEQNSTEIAYYQQQVKTLQDQVTAAQQALDTFTRQNPNLVQGSPQYLTLQRLGSDLDSMRTLETAAENKLNQAQLVSSMTSNSQSTQFRVLDRPGTMLSTRSRLKYLGLGLGAALGLVTTIIILVTWQDKSVRTGDDLAEITDLPVLAVVPHLRSRPKTASTVTGRQPAGDRVQVSPSAVDAV